MDDKKTNERTVDELTEDEQREFLRQDNPDGPRLQVVTGGDLLIMPFPPREMVLSPILPTQGTMMVYSKRGVGKTYVAMAGACAVAAGGAILRWRAPKPRRVLYVDGEMPAITMRDRFAAIVAGMDVDMDPQYFRIVTPDLQTVGMPSLSGTIGQTMIEDQLGDTELLILDNLSCLCRGGKENEAESWLPVQDWALSLRRRGISVMFVHHAGKTGVQRGTSRREDILDTVVNLRHPDDYDPTEGCRFEVHFEKTRTIFGEDVRPFEARLVLQDGKAAWLVSPVSHETGDLARDLFAEGKSIRQVAQELGISKSQAHRFRMVKGGRHDDA
jgi:putative DNA primase/helicase